MLLHFCNFDHFDSLEDVVDYLIEENRLHNPEVKQDVAFRQKARKFAAEKLNYNKEDEIGRYFREELVCQIWHLAALAYVLYLDKASYLALCDYYGYSKKIFKHRNYMWYLNIFASEERGDLEKENAKIKAANAKVSGKKWKLHLLGGQSKE